MTSGSSVDFRFPESLRLVAARPPHPPAGRSGLFALNVHSPSAGEGPSPSADGLKKAPGRATLPDFWGPMVRSNRTRNRTPSRGSV